MPRVKLKPGVKLVGIRGEMCMAHVSVVAAFEERGYDCIVTSGLDGQHKSIVHPLGDGLDYRTKHVAREELHDLVGDVVEDLGPEYDVVLEDVDGPNEHLHVECDPKRAGG